jgi:hypothetical protein
MAQDSYSPAAFTKPDKMVTLEAATAATTLRLMKERRVRPLVVGESSVFIGSSLDR